MAFRNDAQRAEACRVLCERVRRRRSRTPELWTSDGPTDYALDVRDGRASLSRGERILVLAAWDFWNGSGALPLSSILETLDREHTDALASLIIAAKVGPKAIDAWIASAGGRL